MISIISNQNSSTILNKIPINISLNITQSLSDYAIESSSSLISQSGHIYEQGNVSGKGKQMIVYCDRPFYISDGGSEILSSNIVRTTSSNQKIKVHTEAGTFIQSFPYINPIDTYNHIYCDPTSLKKRVTNELAAHYQGSSSFGNQFGIGWNQHNTWTRGIDFTGLGMGNSYRYVTLISPKHGITCAHSPPAISESITFYNTQSQAIHTNVISSFSNLPGSDLLLVTFSSSCSPLCTPSWVLPVNWNNYIYDVNNTPYEPVFPCIVINGNKNTVECRAWSTFDFPLGLYQTQVNGLVPDCLFTSNESFTGGQSGTPVLTLVNGKRVLMFSFFGAASNGPFVSNPTVFNWLSSSISPLTMSVVDLTGYQSTF